MLHSHPSVQLLCMNKSRAVRAHQPMMKSSCARLRLSLRGATEVHLHCFGNTTQGHLSWPDPTHTASLHPVGFISQGPAEGNSTTSEVKLALAVSKVLLRIHTAPRKPLPVTLTLHSQPSPSTARAALDVGKPILCAVCFSSIYRGI